MAPALRGIPRGAVGHDDLTDAPNFGTEFGRRRPFPRYGVPSHGYPERGVVAGHPLRGWSRQKKNA